MSLFAGNMASIDYRAKRYAIFVVTVLCFFSGPTIGEEYKFSDRYSVKTDPSIREQLGEKLFDEVMAFFHTAEKALETKDLEALMDLYSENYSDGEHDKKSAERIWKRIFSTFDKMATIHNMRLINVSPDKNLVIMRCTGLMAGKPEGDKGVITIDNWNQQDHVLIREDGRFKLIGSFGLERKRLWFDKPMHPLL